MASKGDFDRFVEDIDNRRQFIQERTILELTELICGAMKKKGVSRTQLAGLAGKKKGQITQMLNGGRNLTLRSLSDLLFALDLSLEPLVRDVSSPSGRYIRCDISINDCNWQTYNNLELASDEMSNNFVTTGPLNTRGAA